MAQVAAAQEASPSLKQEVLQANTEFFQAATRHDVETLDKRVADKAVFMAPLLVLSKDQFIASEGRLLPLLPDPILSAAASRKNIQLSGVIQNTKILKVAAGPKAGIVEGRLWVAFPGQKNKTFSFTNFFAKDAKNDKGWQLRISTYKQAEQTLPLNKAS